MQAQKPFEGKSVLLINPWIYDFAAYDMWAKPLGLLYIGAVLRSLGCKITYIDCLGSKRFNRKAFGTGKYRKEPAAKPDAFGLFDRAYYRYGISDKEFIGMLESADMPDAVLVTSLMTYWYPGVVEAIRQIRGVFKSTPVILGGIYATLLNSHAVNFSGADIVISGEGEAAVVNTLGSMFNSVCPEPAETFDLNSLPYPCFDLTGLSYVCIQATRGCPYRCTYCASGLINNKFRARNPIMVADEIEFWNSKGASDFTFYDDALFFNAGETAIPLMQEIIRRKLAVRFHCPNGLHANAISRDVARLMSLSGFKTIRIGLETSDIGLQSSTGGKVSNSDFLYAVKNLHKAGYSPDDIGVYVLCGIPNQNFHQVLDTIELVRSAGASPMIAEYSPIPGTALWKDAVNASPFPIESEPLFQNNSILPCRWKGLTYEMYRKLKASLKSF